MKKYIPSILATILALFGFLFLISSVILIIAFIALLIYINSGGIYETKTIGAMIFRISLTLVFAITAYFTISKNKKLNNIIS